MSSDPTVMIDGVRYVPEPPPELERPAPLYEVGARVVDDTGPMAPTLFAVVDACYRRDVDGKDGEWWYSVAYVPDGDEHTERAEWRLRRATPAELYPVGSPDRIDEFNHGWRITGHREGDYALEVENLTAHPAIRPVYETRSVAEWEAMELAPEPPPEPTIEERFPVGSWYDWGAKHVGGVRYVQILEHHDINGQPRADVARFDAAGTYLPDGQRYIVTWSNGAVMAPFNVPCDPPEPPAPAGPWRPPATATGGRVLVLLSSPCTLAIRHADDIDDEEDPRIEGWMPFADALALIDAGSYDVRPIATLTDDHDEQVWVLQRGKWVVSRGTLRKYDATYQRTHWCPLPPVPPIPEGE